MDRKHQSEESMRLRGQRFVSQLPPVWFGGQNIRILAHAELRQWPGSSPRLGQLHSDFSVKKDSNIVVNMGLVTRKPHFVACKQQRCRSACTSMQSDKHF